MDDLREKVIALVRNATVNIHSDIADAGDVADAILALPEIAEALAAFDPDDHSPVYLSPEDRQKAQAERNVYMRATLDRLNDD